MDPTTRFKACVARGASPIEEVALCISAHADASVDIDEQLSRLDSLAVRCRSAGGATSLAALCRYLAWDLGMRGDHVTYYDPENSRIDRVLDRTRGNPITLSAVWMAVARRVGLDLVGVGMPGHFLVRERDDEEAFGDPFYGVCLDLGGCERLYIDRNGPASIFVDAYVEPVTELDMAARMLANLTAISVHLADHSSLAWVLRLRTFMPGADASTHRQLAGVLGHLGRYWEAAEVHEQLIDLQPSRAEEHRLAIRRLRAHGN